MDECLKHMLSKILYMSHLEVKHFMLFYHDCVDSYDMACLITNYVSWRTYCTEETLSSCKNFIIDSWTSLI